MLFRCYGNRPRHSRCPRPPRHPERMRRIAVILVRLGGGRVRWYVKRRKRNEHSDPSPALRMTKKYIRLGLPFLLAGALNAAAPLPWDREPPLREAARTSAIAFALD